MSIPDAASRQRLAAMGIDVWMARGQEPVVAAPAAVAGQGAHDVDDELRIRMASGTGRWLLVQHEPWSGAHEQLLADIMATLGSQDCRFGQWAVSDSAGVTLDDLGERGIEHVLAFGPAPRPVSGSRVHQAPALDELARDGNARRQLWQILAPLLAS